MAGPTPGTSSTNYKAMIYVYAIRSINHNYNYVGIAKDLSNRVNRHNSGYEKATRPYLPFRLIYKETAKDYKEARKREKFLKSGAGREFLKQFI